MIKTTVMGGSCEAEFWMDFSSCESNTITPGSTPRDVH